MTTLEKAVEKFDSEKTGFFRFKKLGDKFLLTNDVGRYCFLDSRTFGRFLQGTLPEGSKTTAGLREAGFVKDPPHYDCMAGQWRAKNAFLWQGPSLHIVVVTLRCNHRCVYCQANSKDFQDTRFDMTQETAQKVVDTIFQSPSQDLTIEFQGGEPLANWPVVKYIVDYARQKNGSANKKLALHLVTNLSLMDEEKLEWLMEREVHFCTSLDGPEDLHNRNRIYLGGNSHADTVRWWKAIMKRTTGKIFRIDALMTTTRHSLAYPREIVDEYVRLGARGIYLRSLSPFGLGRRSDTPPSSSSISIAGPWIAS